MTANLWSIAWDCAEDGLLTWNGGHDFVLPLQQSLSLHYYQGWAKAFRTLGVNGGLRVRFVNGYEYRQWQWTPIDSFATVDQAYRASEQQVPELWANRWLPEIQRDLEAWRIVDLAALSNVALASHLQTILAAQLRHWEIHAIMGSLPLGAVNRFVEWILANLDSAAESDAYRLLQGQSNTSIEANQELWQISQLAKRLLSAETLAHIAQNLDLHLLPAELSAAFANHVANYGKETADQQRQALSLISKYCESNAPEPMQVLHQLAEERQQFTAQLRATLSDEQRPIFDHLHAVALANNPLTESHNLWLDQMSDAATKRVIRQVAERLTTRGILARADEVDYLSVYELLQWGYGLTNPLRPLVEARQAEYERHRKLKPPTFIGKAPAEPTQEAEIDRFGGPSAPLAAEPDTIRGIAASIGIAHGRAFVCQTLDEAFGLRPGEILVCSHTNPSWTPFFALAAALITDRGGALCHAAVVAREVQLPAVVGCQIATQQITTGQWLIVDGGNGVVTVTAGE